MAQQVKGIVANSDNPSSIPRFHVEGRTNYCKLSSDLRACARVHAHAQINNNNNKSTCHINLQITNNCCR